jgi:hypothetical protein
MRYRNKASYTFNDAEADANHGGLRRCVEWRRLMRKVLFCRCERPRPPASSHTHTLELGVSERVSLSSGCRSFLNFASCRLSIFSPLLESDGNGSVHSPFQSSAKLLRTGNSCLKVKETGPKLFPLLRDELINEVFRPLVYENDPICTKVTLGTNHLSYGLLQQNWILSAYFKQIPTNITKKK